MKPYMSFQEYAAIRAVNWSTLRNLHTSPLHYREGLTNPKPPTPPMLLGTAIHTAILEPALFEAEYALWPDAKRGKAYEEFKVEHEGQSILNAEEWQKCMGAAWAVHRSRQGREARRIMRGCKREATLQWIDPDTRVRCKARPDLIGKNVLADVKTTTSTDARKFGRLAGDMLYHGKMAFAAMGLDVLGHPVERVTIIAVEQSPPHDVGVFDIDDAALAMAGDMVCDLLQKLKRCRKRRSWPGRCENTQVLDLAPWLFEPDTDLTDLGIAFEARGGNTS